MCQTNARASSRLDPQDETLLQKLADAALELTGGGSAGITVLEREGDQHVFRWRAIAGQFGERALHRQSANS
jgi:hypothetical protein